MANKFLDETGLSHLWSKITSIFAKKSEVEPFYIDCTIAQNGNTTVVESTGTTPTQSEVDTAFTKGRPLFLRWEAGGAYIPLSARLPFGASLGYEFILIIGDTISTIIFTEGTWESSVFAMQEKIAVVSDEKDVEDGKITIVV